MYEDKKQDHINAINDGKCSKIVLDKVVSM